MNLAAILADAHFPELKRYVLGHIGLAYYNDKNEDLAARLALRMGVLHAGATWRFSKAWRARTRWIAWWAS